MCTFLGVDNCKHVLLHTMCNQNPCPHLLRVPTSLKGAIFKGGKKKNTIMLMRTEEKWQHHQAFPKMWAETTRSTWVTWHVTLLYVYIYITMWEPTIARNSRVGKGLLNATGCKSRHVLYCMATIFLLFCFSNRVNVQRLDDLSFGKESSNVRE